MVGEYRRLVALTAVVLAMVALASVTHQIIYNPEAALRREMEHLRDQGVPVERVYRDDGFGCLVVEFSDMEDEYVQPVRELVGYSQPVLFRELDTPEAHVGEPPATPMEICRASCLARLSRPPVLSASPASQPSWRRLSSVCT